MKELKVHSVFEKFMANVKLNVPSIIVWLLLLTVLLTGLNI